jgi:hypothetical protein
MEIYIIRFQDSDGDMGLAKFHAEDEIHAVNQLLNAYSSVDESVDHIELIRIEKGP